ncbi:penicillin-binding transpeptidase domain-containing protein [Microlunatus soli]|uniref:Cell division protein FtsI/penicillin-binding protein 2 n=1 Tax=Microlunatus soli TaxID=630515 RepID=A0A1H1N0R4_9ACTN|nr:penicillin-binding transpeptidase domain-containing protein [Microlunatus soli]SDR92507.1 Cell division protein FtsI/penicillin-binding protein 2 [Microlunatus soli]
MLVPVLVTGLGACSGKVPLPGKSEDVEGAKKATTALAAALTKQDLSSVAFTAATPNAAKDFSTLVDPLDNAKLRATATGEPTVDDDHATSKITMTWRLPGASKPWTYTVTADFDKPSDAWQTVWKPSLVQPDLKPGGKLALSREQPERGKILDGKGTALMKERAVQRIGIDKSRVSAAMAAKSAASLAKLLDIDAADYAKLVKSAGDKAFVQAIVYRSNDPELPSESKITAIDGAVALDDQAVLGPTKTFAAPILGTVGEATKEIVDKSDGEVAAGDQVGLSGLESRYDEQLRGRPAVSVSVVPPQSASPSASPSAGSSPTPGASASPEATHTTRVFHEAAKPGKDLKISLDSTLQKAAESAIAQEKSATSLVAIRPSTGEIVAAANGEASDGQNLATYGQYPPGSTFKIIDALALIRKGIKPTDTMSCPKTITVDGRKFENYDDYPASKIGSVDFRTAFANSCNTAFIGQRNKVDSDDLSAAAASLGFGTDYDVGFPAYFGSIPKPESDTERGAEMIGQGRVQASPMAMATVVASVQAGKTVLPRMVDGTAAKSKAEPLTASEVKQLRELMHAVVTDGSGAMLTSLEPPQIIAKTGTAEYGDETPPKTHAWMVAGQDDLAVAVFVDEGDSGSGVAGPLLKSFLQQAK